MRTDFLQALLALAGRWLLAVPFLVEGIDKLRAYVPATRYMERFGVPGSLLPLVIAAEIGGGLMLVLGWGTRLAASGLALFCIATAVLFHTNLAARGDVLHLEKDLAIAGGMIVLALCGPGRLAIRPGNTSAAR